MKIGIIKEKANEELRVAASPETVQKIVGLGADVLIETSAGEGASIKDSDYTEAGAIIEKNADVILKNSDVILKVQLQDEEIAKIKKGAVLIGLLAPMDNKKRISDIAKSRISAFSMEFVPRITRAQSMDVLSSQSNLAGYKAVLDGVDKLDKAVPMMMTAAGIINPARVLILGAGVAGLQAIATAKRLGAIVSSFDVRPDVKEQVESLGATFIEVESEEDAETAGGYAKEMSEDYKRKQSELIEETIKTQDLVITTALIPGRAAPLLITKKMVTSMKEGSIIVDLAVTAGGNCELSERGKVVKKHGVSIVGYENVPSRVSRDASMLYAKNLFNLLALIIDKESGEIKIDIKDEIISGTLLTHNGKIIHPNFSEPVVKQGTRKKTTKKKELPKKVVQRKPHQASKPKAKKPIKRKAK